MRAKKALINFAMNLLYEIVAIICGFILPRIILGAFGSAYNGITTSVSQFLSCIAIMQSGIGGVTRAALYKPLASNNIEEISGVLKATENFMRKVSLLFVAFLVLMALGYPLLVKGEFGYLFSSSLVLILGLSTFIQYYFGYTYQMLIIADQKQYIISILQVLTILLNTIVSFVLIKLGFGIHIVKLGSSIVFCVSPLFYNYYVKKKYKIIKTIYPLNNAIKQRWDAFAHQLSNFVFSNTDIMVLTFFTNIKEVSVYSVYYLVINGLNKLIKNTFQGLTGAFGNMLANKEYETMNRSFDIYEVMVFFISTVIFSVSSIMITPFIDVYTKDIIDVNYHREMFGYLAILAAFMTSIRIPYQNIVEIAGHYKETKNGALIEAGLNLCLSIVLVFKFGMIGVVIGTLVAAFFRTVQYSVYMSKHIVKRSYFRFIKIFILSLISWALIATSTKGILVIKIDNYYSWFVIALGVTGIAITINLMLYFVFYSYEIKLFTKKMLTVLRNTKR